MSLQVPSEYLIMPFLQGAGSGAGALNTFTAAVVVVGGGGGGVGHMAKRGQAGGDVGATPVATGFGQSQ